MQQLLGIVLMQATVTQRLFQSFQPGLRPDGKVDQPNQQETIYLNKTQTTRNRSSQ